MRARDIPLDEDGDIPSCTCFHMWDDHRRGGGACTRLDSYGEPCACPGYDRDPNNDAEEGTP